MRALTIAESRLYHGLSAFYQDNSLMPGRDRPVGVGALTRIKVIDYGGVDGVVDLTRYGLQKTDLVQSWDVSESADEPAARATVRLATQAGWETPLPIAGAAAVLSPGRRRSLVIESALAPPDRMRDDDNLLDDATVWQGDYAAGGDRTGSVHAFQVTAVGATLARSTAQHFAGTGSVQVTTVAGAGSGLLLSFAPLTLRPNARYELSAWVRVASGTQTLRIELYGGSVNGTTDVVVGTAWTRITVTGTTGATGTIIGQITNAAGGAFVFYVDALSLVHDDGLNWRRIFEGYIDTVDWNWREQAATIECRDRGAELQDTFIEEERSYGSGAGVAVQAVMQAIINDNFGVVWATPYTPAVGSYVRPTVYNGFAYVCTVSGAVAGAEPSWPTTIGTTVADGGATWVCATRYPNLYTPVAPAPAWLIRTYKQQRMPVLEALQTLAQQIGWDVRFRWDATTSTYLLYFWEPDRAKVAEDAAFLDTDAHLVREVTRERRSVEQVRNIVRVVWTNEDGTGSRGAVESLDTTTMTQGFGRRFAEFAEASNSNVGALAEAQLMADAARDDLKLMRVECDMEFVFYPFAELSDLYLFAIQDVTAPPDEMRSTPLAVFTLATSGFLAVLGYQHRGSPGLTVTTLQLREAQVTGAMAKWLQREVRPGNAAAAPDKADALQSWLRCWRGAVQNINAGAWTVVLFDTEGVDSTNGYLPATGQWTCPRTGIWTVESLVTLLLLGAGVLMQVGIFVNGALYYQEQIATAGGTQPIKVTLTGLQLDGGDTVDVRVQHNDGVARNASGTEDTTWLVIGRQR